MVACLLHKLKEFYGEILPSKRVCFGVHLVLLSLFLVVAFLLSKPVRPVHIFHGASHTHRHLKLSQRKQSLMTLSSTATQFTTPVKTSLNPSCAARPWSTLSLHLNPISSNKNPTQKLHSKPDNQPYARTQNFHRLGLHSTAFLPLNTAFLPLNGNGREMRSSGKKRSKRLKLECYRPVARDNDIYVTKCKRKFGAYCRRALHLLFHKSVSEVTRGLALICHVCRVCVMLAKGSS